MIRACFLAAALLASAPNCTDLYSVGTHGFEVPTISLQSATDNPVGDAVHLVVDFQAHNPNPYPLTLSSVDYQVAVQGVPVFSATQPGLEVEGTSDGRIELTGDVQLSSPALAGLRPGESASYLLSGTVHVDSPAGVPIDVDYSTSGTFYVPAPPPSGR